VDFLLKSLFVSKSHTLGQALRCRVLPALRRPTASPKAAGLVVLPPCRSLGCNFSNIPLTGSDLNMKARNVSLEAILHIINGMAQHEEWRENQIQFAQSTSQAEVSRFMQRTR
jgi:hypothetical protein